MKPLDKPPPVEAHHQLTIKLMGKSYAVDFTATAQEVKAEVIEIRPPDEPPRLVLLPPIQKP